MTSIKIEHGNHPEEQIRDHACTIKGARDLLYAVSTASFDGIWRRTGVHVNRSSWATPRLQINGGRHEVLVAIDDSVPMDEVKLVQDTAP